MNVSSIMKESIETYEEMVELVIPLGLLVLLVSSFLMLGATYISAGAGFVRYQDIVTMNPISIILFIAISLVGLFAFSFLSVGVTALVKFKRTMDELSFFKLANRALKYSLRVFVAWFSLSAVSFVIGYVFKSFEVPDILLALVLVLLWWGVIFLPQTIVLDDSRLLEGIASSIRYSLKNPVQLLVYYFIGFVMIFSLTVLEVLLEAIPAFYWIAPFISSLFLFLFVVPFLEIIKCQYYISTKYKITKAGLT